MRAVVLGSLLLGLGPLTGDTGANAQCTYQFPTSRTMLALDTRTFAEYGRAALAPGNVLAVSFSNIAVPEEGIKVTGASLFVIPTFHVGSSALLEVAVAQSGGYEGQNAPDLESRGTVSGWSISNAQVPQRDVWQPCRYYEVGGIEDDIRHVISNRTFADRPTEVDVFLRHRSGGIVFVEGNNDTYVDNVVLQIRGDCGWDISNGWACHSASSSSSGCYAKNHWDYTTGSAGEQGLSTSYYGEAPGRMAENSGPIRNGQRHPLCGGEDLDFCDLGPYRPSDVGDGSCQQHLNTEGCYYDGGDCCSVTCERASTSDTPYACQGRELDPYYCSDPEYAIDLESPAHSQTSAATSTRSFPSSVWRRPIGLARSGSWGAAAGFRGEVLASLIVTMVMVVAAKNTVPGF